MKYLVLFVCSMIIPAMNTSAVSIALSNNIVDLIFYIIDYIIQGVIIILFAVYISYKNRSIKG